MPLKKLSNCFNSVLCLVPFSSQSLLSMPTMKEMEVSYKQLLKFSLLLVYCVVQLQNKGN